MAISKDFLWNTIAQLADELQRVDPGSVIAARVSGFIEAREMGLHTTDRHLENKRSYKDPEEDGRVASLYLGGESIERVALKTGHATATVRAALARQGVTARPSGEAQKVHFNRRDDERIERIRALRADGKTLEEIGTELHVTRERVRQICVRNGIDAQRGLTPAERAGIDAYLAGESLLRAAQVAGIGHTTMRNVLTKNGHAIRTEPNKRRYALKTLADAQRAAQMYADGATNRQIANAIGIQMPTIYRLLAIAGVKPNRGGFGQAKQQGIAA